MKPKILGMKSESYPEGRIDSFKIDEQQGGFEAIISCLVDFGFSENAIRGDIDLILEDRGYLFLYLSPKLKIHLSAEESKDSFMIRFDTSIPKDKILTIIEKYFQFPK